MAWCVLCGTMKTPCVLSKRNRVYVQNVPVCPGTTRTCFNTCAHGAGTHGDVSNVHTEAFFESTHDGEGEGLIVNSAHQNLPT